jgi:hypothetical protein
MNEISWYVLLHAGLGDLGALCFLWVVVELINAKEEGLKRARAVSLTGLILISASWIVGGYYYVTTYGKAVKPVIVGSAYAWAHGIIMEAKEHIFLFIPLMAAVVVIGLFMTRSFKDIASKGRTRLGMLSALVFLTGFSMAMMGFLIAVGARAALAAGNVVTP